MAADKKFYYDDGKEMDYDNLPKRDLEKMSDQEIHKAYQYLWGACYHIKGDTLTPLATMVNLELRTRESKKSDTKWIFSRNISIIALAVTVLVGLGSMFIANKTLQSDSELDTKWYKLHEEKFNKLIEGIDKIQKQLVESQEHQTDNMNELRSQIKSNLIETKKLKKK